MEQKKEPPGVPVGPPPELEEEEEDDPMEGVTREQSLIHASRKTIRCVHVVQWYLSKSYKLF